METIQLGPLRAVRLVARGVSTENDGDKGPLTCVFLHGFGAPGDDLVGLAGGPGGIDAPPGTTFIFPQAPHTLEDFIGQPVSGEARAWWMIDVVGLERAIARGEPRDLAGQVPEGLAAARTALGELLDAIPRDQRIVLGGFSQGAMLSLDLALREPARPLAGVVLLSGTIIAEREWRPLMADARRKGTKVFQSHGEHDAILPFGVAERLRDELTEAGLEVTFDPFAGPHTIPPRTLGKLGGWLKSL